MYSNTHVHQAVLYYSTLQQARQGSHKHMYMLRTLCNGMSDTPCADGS